MSAVVAMSTLWAICWLAYRAYQVFQKPIPELIEKLALDIPPAPDIVLESISATEVQMSWKQPDAQNSTIKHQIYLNDDNIGETKRSETEIVILHLKPNTRYTIRVFAISNSDHKTPSQFVGVQTAPLQPEFLEDAPDDESPEVRAFAPLPGHLLPTSAPAMVREPSGGQPHGKKLLAGRRHSPASGQDSMGHSNSDDLSNSNGRRAAESLEQLAEHFQRIQREMEDLDKQVLDEEAAHKAQMEAAIEERDRLRKEWREKEEASVDLKKQVANLDRENRNVQNKKNAREKALRQKQDEGEKRRTDIIRWKEEISDMMAERSRLQSETVENEKRAAERAQECRDQIAELQAETKAIEEENRVKATDLKTLEEERNSLLSGTDSEEAKEFDRIEKEKDREWEMKLLGLQSRSQALMQQFQQAQIQCREAEHYLASLTTRRLSASALGPVPSLDMDPVRKNSKRRNRQRSSLASNMSSPTGNFPVSDASIPTTAGFAPSSNMSPTFPGGGFYNKWGGAFPTPSDESVPTQADVDNLTGGAPMSPRADSLLPSNLLGDEEPLVSSPVTRPSLPFGSPVDNHHSHSPISTSSRPPSIFSSPRDSSNHLPDLDRRSVHSVNVSSPTAPTQSTSSRLSSFFNPTRQRGKTMDEEPPLLGSLKLGQSQSLPRNQDDYDPLATRRRGTSWMNSAALSNFWTRSSGPGANQSSGSTQIPNTRRMWPTLFKDKPTAGSLTSLTSDLGTGYNQFGSRLDVLEGSNFLRGGSSSPRPLSTYSAEHALPRPYGDSGPFGWPIFDKSGARNSPLGPDWSSPQPWSRSQSRRPSFQYGSTSNLSLGPQEVTDIIESPEELRRPLQAPIGTRPASSSQRPATPKLNPAAPSFKLFSTKKTEKDKTKKKETDKAPEISPEDASPPDSRQSRDSRSITTAESHVDTLERTPSGTPSEGPTGQKTTLIQKITRKSSSNKFNIPWSNKLSKKGESSTPGEIDEDEASDQQLGKSVDSVASAQSRDKAGEKEKENPKERAVRNSLSFKNFSVMRKSKKPDKAMNELTASESSERASETGDEDVVEDM